MYTVLIIIIITITTINLSLSIYIYIHVYNSFNDYYIRIVLLMLNVRELASERSWPGSR